MPPPPFVSMLLLSEISMCIKSKIVEFLFTSLNGFLVNFAGTIFKFR